MRNIGFERITIIPRRMISINYLLLQKSENLSSFDRFRDSLVAVSTSQDIHNNLAVEDWLYKNCDFSHYPSPLLLLWRNRPCVVIGRHQNPWLECSLLPMIRDNVVLARRNSGGGTVYHDLGNLNCTFFTERSKYDRKSNLNLLCEAMRSQWPLNVRVSSREDIILDNMYKISGTASKLGRKTAYHHCTLLFNVNKSKLSLVLKRDEIASVESKATKSVKAPVKNLGDVWPSVNFETLVNAIVKTFQSRYQLPFSSSGSYYFEPSEDHFPGVTAIQQDLQSWEWLYGKCPSFTLKKNWQSPADGPIAGNWTMAVSVQRGVIEDILLTPDHLKFDKSKAVLKDLVGKRFPFHEPCFDIFINNENTTDTNELLEVMAVKQMFLGCIQEVF